MTMNNPNELTSNGIFRLREAILNSKNLCVFTGAGISCPSGIPDFRSSGGLYSQPGLEGFAPEEIISHDFFKRDPELFYLFYKSKMLYPDAMPNSAHRYFASLESDNRNVAVVTQNIDGLHQAAGSTNVMELHGSVKRNYCLDCGKFYGLETIMSMCGPPHCVCGGLIKPDVVLYGEGLDSEIVESALTAIKMADTMVVVGTSLTVYPAAAYVNYFRGNTMAVINKDFGALNLSSLSANIVIAGDAAEVADKLYEL